jgi:hypothetical protein
LGYRTFRALGFLTGRHPGVSLRFTRGFMLSRAIQNSSPSLDLDCRKRLLNDGTTLAQQFNDKSRDFASRLLSKRLPAWVCLTIVPTAISAPADSLSAPWSLTPLSLARSLLRGEFNGRCKIGNRLNGFGAEHVQ